MSVFGQKAVARVDGVHVGHLGRGDDPGNVEVGIRRRRLADADRPVGDLHVLAFAVGLGVDRHRLDAQFVGGTDDADGDLAAVGNEDA